MNKSEQSAIYDGEDEREEEFVQDSEESVLDYTGGLIDDNTLVFMYLFWCLGGQDISHKMDVVVPIYWIDFGSLVDHKIISKDFGEGCKGRTKRERGKVSHRFVQSVTEGVCTETKKQGVS